VIANYYNKSLKWNQGKMDVVINLKGVGGRYNSFQNSPELLPFVDRSLVKSTEAIIESQIMAYPFQTETSIADWHYRAGERYMDAISVIRSLMQNVSRNGTLLLNITQHGRGDLDPQLIEGESAQRRQREFLECVVANAGSCIAVVKGHDLRYTMANSAFQAFVPYVPMVGRTYREVFPEAS
jgi:hypothetical protein